jgi:hypothetical protein
MITLLDQIQITNALLCLLLAVQLLAMKAMRPIPKRILGLNYLLYAHQSILLVAILAGHGRRLFSQRQAVAMLFGPALYVYFSCVRQKDASLHAKDGAHFLIGLLVFALLSLVNLTQAAIKLQVPASQLSNAISQLYRKSVSVHLNDLRIQEANLARISG